MPRDPHLLAGRRGGAEHEEVARQAVVRRAPLLRRALDARVATTTSATVGIANSDEQDAAPGSIDASSTTVTTSRRIQPSVEKIDMNRWSSANTWSRSTASRSR